MFELDPRRSNFVAIVGRKGSGKSHLARELFDSYPFDRAVIDVTGDIRLTGEDLVQVTAPLPTRFPMRREGHERVTARFVPDPGSPSFLEDMDQVIAWGMNSQPGRCCIWIDENESLMPVEKTPPATRRALQQGRHRNLTLLMTQIRAMRINPMAISQADHVIVFDLPQPSDRKRIAENIGYPAKAFDSAVHGLGPHEFLWWDTNAGELTHCEPLPAPNKALPR